VAAGPLLQGREPSPCTEQSRATVDLRIGFLSLFLFFLLSFHFARLVSFARAAELLMAVPLHSQRRAESVDDTMTSKVACLVEPVFHLVEVQSCAITRFASFRRGRWVGASRESGSRLVSSRPRRSCSGLTALQTGERERSRAGQPVALLYAHTYKLVSLRVFVLLCSFRLPTASCSCYLVATSFLLIPVHPSHTLTNTHALHRSSKPASPPPLPHNTKTAPASRASPPRRRAAHASTAGAREPPAPARARAALVGYLGEEEELRGWLEELREEVGVRGGRMRGKLGELWALVGALGAAREDQAGGEWKVVG
jgi:hypothetical protein